MIARVVILLSALVCSPGLAQAPRVFVAATWNVARSSGDLPEHRLQFGVRWRPCVKTGAGGSVCAQAGGTLIEDDLIRFARVPRTLRHLAVGVEGGSARWRIGASLGQFDQNTDAQPIRYYRFVALRFEHRGVVGVTFEPQLFQFTVADAGTPIHEQRLLVRWRSATLDIQRTEGRNVPVAYDHVTATLMIAPRPFLVRIGSHSVPDTGVAANRNRARFLAQAGLWWGAR